MIDLSQASGKKWVLSSATFQNSGSVTANSNGNKPYLEVDSSGGVKGHSGCNYFSGNFFVGQGQHPKLVNLISTLLQCSDGLEGRFYSLLGNEFSLESSSSQLSFVGLAFGEAARFDFQLEQVAGGVNTDINLQRVPGGTTPLFTVGSGKDGGQTITLNTGLAYETDPVLTMIKQRFESYQIINLKPIPINTGLPGNPGLPGVGPTPRPPAPPYK